MARRVCIFGGSFDPIHLAHIHMAEAAIEQFSLDDVVFMPTGTSYHKGHASASAEDRNAVIRLAIAGRPHMSISTLDQSRGGDTYTADTLAIIRAKHPDEEIYFLLGADSLMHMQSWYRPDMIFASAAIIVVQRPGVNPDECRAHAKELEKQFPAARILFLDSVFEDISSTRIRELAWMYVSTGKKSFLQELSALVTPEAADYIVSRRLYADEDAWTEAEILDDLKEKLSEERYAHTLGVADTAEALAENYGAPAKQARIAGVLHDCGKFLKGDEYIRRAQMADIELSEAELANSALIHAKLGAYYAKERYHIRDEDILSAIRSHTTGHPDMTLLEEIIYVADYIEPNRDEAPNLEVYRKSAYENLGKTVMMIANDVLEHLKRNGSTIDDLTRETWLWYREHYGDPVTEK